MKRYCLALPISLLVFASAAAPQTPSSSVPLISREDTYRLFVFEVGTEELNIAQAIRRNELPLPERRKFSECLALRNDADQIIYPILTGAFQEIQTAEQVVNNAVGHRRQLSQEEAAQLVPVFEVRDRKEDATIKSSIAILQEKLGEEGFKKLDAYIFDWGGGGKPLSALQSRNRCLDKCNPEPCTKTKGESPKSTDGTPRL